MVKLADIACAAKVSKAAVSYAFSDDPAKRGKLSPCTLERILKIAAELDYSPSWMARAFAKQKSYNIALLMPERCTYGMSRHYLGIFHGVSSAVGDSDYNLSVFFGCGHKFQNNIQQGRIDGVLALARRDDAEIFQKMAQWDLPLVFLNRTAPEVCVNAGSCSSDYEAWLTEILQKYQKRKIKKCVLYYRDARDSDKIICNVFSKLCRDYGLAAELLKRDEYCGINSDARQTGFIFCGSSPAIIAELARRSDVEYAIIISPEYDWRSGLKQENLYYHNSSDIGSHGVQMLFDMIDKHAGACHKKLPLIQLNAAAGWGDAGDFEF